MAGLRADSLFRPGPPQNEQLAQVLHQRTGERVADSGGERVTFRPLAACQAYLDQFVRLERDVDLAHYCGRDTLPANEHDRMQMMRLCEKSAPLRRREHNRGVVHRGEIMPGPLNPTGKKHRFGKAWMQEHVNDPYVREAERRGYRSRAAFKLIELAEKDRLLRPGMTVVDLGAAPGSWSQVLRERLGPRATIVAVDALPMQALPGVTSVTADFNTDDGLDAVVRALSGRPVDLVVSDMAPNLSGIDSVDQARSVHLAELALEFSCQYLRPGGDLVVKVFQGSGLAELQRAVQGAFAKVHVRKPKASRDRSREVFVVARQRRAP